MTKDELIVSLQNLIEMATDNMANSDGSKKEYYYGEKMGLLKALVNVRCLNVDNNK